MIKVALIGAREKGLSLLSILEAQLSLIKCTGKFCGVPA